MYLSLTATAAASLPVLLVWAGAVDVFTRSIPNITVMLLAVCFGLFAGMAGMSAGLLVTHLVCACVVLACGFALFSQSMIGGGDAKLLAGAALWFGFESLLPLLAATAMAGGALALAYLSANAARAYFGLQSERHSTIPYGAAIAAGALVALPDWFASF
jgi:prepilin peptidase CpaA